MNTAMIRFNQARTAVNEVARNHRLGSRQRHVLEALIRHGSWGEGCGWVWNTPSETDGILRSLTRRGFAEITVDRDCSGYGRFRPVESLRIR